VLTHALPTGGAGVAATGLELELDDPRKALPPLRGRHASVPSYLLLPVALPRLLDLGYLAETIAHRVSPTDDATITLSFCASLLTPLMVAAALRTPHPITVT